LIEPQTDMNKNAAETVRTAIGFVAVFSITLIWLIRFRFRDGLQNASLDGDSGGIWQAALNLFQYQTFSSSYTHPPEPNAYLDVGMPMILTVAMWLQGAPQDYLPGIVNGALLCLLACAGYFLVALVSHSQFIGILGGVFAATSWNATRYIHTALTEAAVCTLLVLFLLGLYLLLTRKTNSAAFFVGLVGGALCLVRAPFLYIEIGLIIVLTLIGIRFYPLGKLARLLILSVIGLGVTLGPWTIRNIISLDQVSTNSRGGKILTIRSNFNQMTNDEWLAGFLYWNEDLRRLAPSDQIEGSPTRRLNRRYDGGFLREAGKKQREYHEVYGEVEADRKMRSEALTAIIQQPIQHLKVSLLIAWRGVAHRWEASERYGKYWPGWPLLFLWATGYLIYKRKWMVVLLTVPLFGYIAFYALFTHFIPRYGMVLTPSFILIVAIAMRELIRSAWLSRFANVEIKGQLELPKNKRYSG
jgi:hypothetical protein